MTVSNSIRRAVRRPVDSILYRTSSIVAIHAYRRRWRRQADTAPRVLVIESRVPHARLGAGYPRSNQIVNGLVDLGYDVTLYPLLKAVESRRSAYGDVARDVEIALNLGYPHIEQFLRERVHRYVCVIVTRSHNMALVAPLLQRLGYASVVFDCEALAALRESRLQALRGLTVDSADLDSQIDAELSVARSARCISAVSDDERRIIEKHLPQPVRTLGFARETCPTPRPFGDRWGFLLVGTLVDSQESPNTDAARWFLEEVLPLVRAKLGADVAVRMVGQFDRRLATQLRTDGVELVRAVRHLFPKYDEARVFIAATRFAAGLPLKVYDAASHGVPIVATGLLAKQVGWPDGVGLVVADSPADFAAACVRLHSDREHWERVRQRGIERVAADCSPRMFAHQLRDVVETAVSVQGPGGLRHRP